MGMLKNEGRAKSAWLSLGLGPQRCQARFCEFIFQHSPNVIPACSKRESIKTDIPARSYIESGFHYCSGLPMPSQSGEGDCS